MPDRNRPGQGFHHRVRREVVADIAETARVVETVFGVVRNDATCFLAAVLQSVQPECHKVCCILLAVYAKNTAFFF